MVFRLSTIHAYTWKGIHFVMLSFFMFLLYIIILTDVVSYFSVGRTIVRERWTNNCFMDGPLVDCTCFIQSGAKIGTRIGRL